MVDLTDTVPPCYCVEKNADLRVNVDAMYPNEHVRPELYPYKITSASMHATKEHDPNVLDRRRHYSLPGIYCQGISTEITDTDVGSRRDKDRINLRGAVRTCRLLRFSRLDVASRRSRSAEKRSRRLGPSSAPPLPIE